MKEKQAKVRVTLKEGGGIIHYFPVTKFEFTDSTLMLKVGEDTTYYIPTSNIEEIMEYVGNV